MTIGVTITRGKTEFEFEATGTVCPAEPDVGIMSRYLEIEDITLDGMSAYEFLAQEVIEEIEAKAQEGYFNA